MNLTQAKDNIRACVGLGRECDRDTQGGSCHAFEKGYLERDSQLSPLLTKAAEALDKIQHELGVPQPGYPQPVVNAYEIAREVLKELAQADCAVYAVLMALQHRGMFSRLGLRKRPLKVSNPSRNVSKEGKEKLK